MSPEACFSADTWHKTLEDVKATTFDYFVIFKSNSVVPAVEDAFPGKGAEFARAWRAKQSEHGFLRSFTGRQTDFFRVTEEALVYSAAAMRLELTPEKRKRLLDAYLHPEPWPDAYLHLEPWPDAAPALRKLKASGVRVITISNFSPHDAQGQRRARGDRRPLRRAAEHTGERHLQAGAPRLRVGHGAPEAEEGGD